MDKWILNENGDPIPESDTLAWAAWFENNNEKRRLARDDVGPLCVSTVFLGIDHAFGGPTPVLFESMVFRDGIEFGDYSARYHTREEALAGHRSIVLRLQEGGGCSEEG